MKKQYSQLSGNRGFTLIEIMLVITAMIFLAAIVILAVNPNKQLADARNAQRQSDVTTILDAVYQYTIDNSGNSPTGIATTSPCNTAANQICKSTLTCPGTGYTSLTSELTTNQKYLVALPTDPKNSDATGTGYYIDKSTSSTRFTVCAPLAENGLTISVTR